MELALVMLGVARMERSAMRVSRKESRISLTLHPGYEPVPDATRRASDAIKPVQQHKDKSE
jgi:hypothetical protein